MMISEVPYQDVLTLRQQVMYPDRDIDFVRLPDDDLGLHIGVYEDDRLISVVSIFLDRGEVQFRKLATLSDMQNRGYASSLMQWLIDYANDVKVSRIWCNARITAVGLYEKFGYKKTDNVFSKNGHDYIIMERLFQ